MMRRGGGGGSALGLLLICLVISLYLHNNVGNKDEIIDNVQQEVNGGLDAINGALDQAMENAGNASLPSMNVDLHHLVDSIKISDDLLGDYDRDEWTSSYQYYECLDSDHDNDGVSGDCLEEYQSIRTYKLFESEWYDWETNQYTDPYDGNVKVYRPGDRIYSMDYDHIVPLQWANAHGAAQWSEEQKKAFADDPSVGVVCNSSDNRAKGAKGPSKWLPEENVEDYCYTFLFICEKYDLWIGQEDLDTIMEILNNADMSNVSLINE